MKPLALSIPLLTCLPGMAQPPLPFPTGEVHWTVNMVTMGNSAPFLIHATMGDSTFNGWTYRKIGSAENTGVPVEPEDLAYAGSIRDESGRWLFVPPGSTLEYPLFDFTGDVGDTLTIENPLFGAGEHRYRVEAITSIPVVGGTRRMWTLVPDVFGGYEEYFIEGIGSTHGLFGHATFLSDAGTQLVCMDQDGELIYRMPEATSCSYTTDVADRTMPSGLLLAPNPARTYISAEIQGRYVGHGPLLVTDALGRSLSSQGVREGTDRWTVDVSTLPAGLYTISLALPDASRLHERFVVEH